jgi:hypothetical protein
MTGKSVYSEKWHVHDGINTYSTHLSHLESGVYVMNISDGSKHSSVKFVKIF